MRSDEYIHAKKTVRRTELPDQPLEVFEWERTTRHHNKDWTTKVTHWAGLHLLQIGDEEIIASRSTISDTGPVGVTVVYTKPPATEPTQEERAYNRKIIQRVAAQAMYDQGLW